MQTVSVVQYNVYAGARRQYRFAFQALLVTAVGLGLAYASVFWSPFFHRQPAASTQPVSAPQQMNNLADTRPKAQQDAAAAVTGALQAVFAHNANAKWSAAVYDMQHGQWLAQIDSSRQITSASLYKLYVAYGVAQTIPYSQWGYRTVAGQTVSKCMDLMLRISDNTCGVGLGHLVGWANIDKRIHAYGFTATVLNRAAGPLTTSADTTRFMSDLYSGKLLDKAPTDAILQSLLNQHYREGIPTGCPGCTVYNKTGWLTGIEHDSAIVKSGNRLYAVTIMSQGGTRPQIAEAEQALEAALKAAE